MAISFHRLELLVTIVGLAIVAIGIPLRAQIVNIEDQRSLQWEEKGSAGTIDLGLQLVQNTSQVMTVSERVRFERVHGQWYGLFLQNFSLVQVAGSRFVNKGFVHLRVARKWVDRTHAWEQFVQLQYNERQLIRMRALWGMGLSAKLWAREQQTASGGLSLMGEYNEIKDTSLIYRQLRVNTYFSYRIQISPQVSWTGTCYYQPVLTYWRDWRISVQTAVDVKISKRLSLRVEGQLAYDNRLKTDVPQAVPLIYNLKNVLRIHLGQ